MRFTQAEVSVLLEVACGAEAAGTEAEYYDTTLGDPDNVHSRRDADRKHKALCSAIRKLRDRVTPCA